MLHIFFFFFQLVFQFIIFILVPLKILELFIWILMQKIPVQLWFKIKLPCTLKGQQLEIFDLWFFSWINSTWSLDSHANYFRQISGYRDPEIIDFRVTIPKINWFLGIVTWKSINFRVTIPGNQLISRYHDPEHKFSGKNWKF